MESSPCALHCASGARDPSPGPSCLPVRTSGLLHLAGAVSALCTGRLLQVRQRATPPSAVYAGELTAYAERAAPLSARASRRAMALRQRPSRGGGSPTEPEARGKLNRLLWISLHFSRLLPTCVCSKGSASLLKHRRGRGHPTWAGNNTEAPTLLSYLFSQGWRLVLRLGCRPSRGCGAGRPASPSTRPNCGPDPLPGPLSGPIVQSHCSASCHWRLPLFDWPIAFIWNGAFPKNLMG